jgi:hypothetical protein
MQPSIRPQQLNRHHLHAKPWTNDSEDDPHMSSSTHCRSEGGIIVARHNPSRRSIAIGAPVVLTCRGLRLGVTYDQLCICRLISRSNALFIADSAHISAFGIGECHPWMAIRCSHTQKRKMACITRDGNLNMRERVYVTRRCEKSGCMKSVSTRVRGMQEAWLKA